MKCRGTTLPVVGLVLLLFFFNPAAALSQESDQPADDHGNDFELASPVVVDGSLTIGQIELPDDIDVFKIDLDGLGAGDVMLRLFEWSPTLKPFITIYDQNGRVLDWREAQTHMTEMVLGVTYGQNAFVYASVEDGEAGGIGEYRLSAEIPNHSGQVLDVQDVSTKKDYRIDKARKGAKIYIDRGYYIKDIDKALHDGVMLRTANDDKYNNNTSHVELELNRPADLFVCYDKRGATNPPDWLAEDGWRRTSDRVHTSDRWASPYVVFKKTFYPGEVILGGNHAGGSRRARANYFLIAKPTQGIPVTDPKLIELLYVSSDKPYHLEKARIGGRPYIDRGYSIRQLSDRLQNGVLVKTAMNDKYIRKAVHMVLYFHSDASVFLCYDKRGMRLPFWLKDEAWEQVTDKMVTSDGSAGPMQVFHQRVSAGTDLGFGGNRSRGAWGAHSNYFVIVTADQQDYPSLPVDRPHSTLTGGQPTRSSGSGKQTDEVTEPKRWRWAENYYGHKGIDEFKWVRDGSGHWHNYAIGWHQNDLAEYLMKFGGDYNRLILRGLADKPGPVELEIYVDAVKVATARLDANSDSNQSIAVDIDGIAYGTHAIAVKFKNDKYKKGHYDRNMYLDGLKVIEGVHADHQDGSSSNGGRPESTLTGGQPTRSLGSGKQTAEVTEPEQWRWAENYYGHKGIDEIKWMRDGSGRRHNYAIGWHQNDLAEYLMKFGGDYNRLVLRGLADKPGPVELEIYVDAVKMAVARWDANSDSNQSVTVDIDGIAYGTHAIAVKFKNDKYKKGHYDRNMYLDGLKVIR